MFSYHRPVSENQLDGTTGMFNSRGEIYHSTPVYTSTRDDYTSSRSSESYRDLRDRLRPKVPKQEATALDDDRQLSSASKYRGLDFNREREVYEDRSRGRSEDEYPLPKYRKTTPKEEPMSIGQDMTSIFDQTLKEVGLSSEQRIFKLVKRLKNRSVHYSLDSRQVQLLVEKFLNEIIKEKNWTSMTVEKALLLCATVDDRVEPKIGPSDFHQCEECAVGYPSGKYQCVCGERFVHLSFLQAHKLTAHGMPPPLSEVFICEDCHISFENSVRDLAIHIRSRHMCPYEHLECPYQCGVLIVERNVNSEHDHVARKHECSVCHDTVGVDPSWHRKTFHKVPQELLQLGDAVTRISSTDVETFLTRTFPASTKDREPIVQDTPESPPREQAWSSAAPPEIVKNELPESSIAPVVQASERVRNVCTFVSCDSCGLRTPFGGYKCKDCPKSFEYRVHLFQHLCEEHESFAGFSLFCEICGLLCTDLTSLLSHVMKERHPCPSQHLQCAYGCSKFLTSYEHLALHNDKTHEFFCPKCNKVVAVIDKNYHINNCGRRKSNVVDNQSLEENLMANCEKCSFQCPQGMGFVCDICLLNPSSSALHEFVDEIELLYHSLLYHKEKSVTVRAMTISCVLCPASEDDDAFDILSFIHHRKAVHSICEIHVRCPNKPCDKILPIGAPGTGSHINGSCEFRKDLEAYERISLANPSWKACRHCLYVGYIKSISYCDLCPGDISFVSTVERALHMCKRHGYGGTIPMTCALCRVSFADLYEFDLHRSNHHKFCERHVLCLNNQNCDFLFGSLDQANHHANNDNFCAIQLPYGRKNRSKFCNSCAGFFKVQSIAVCYFCDSRPTFISVEDYLCHLLQLHGRKVAGWFSCHECEEKFEDPKLLSDHVTTTHKRCNMHQFCSNSMECYTVFPRGDPEQDHPCNYETNSPRIPEHRPPESKVQETAPSTLRPHQPSRGIFSGPLITLPPHPLFPVSPLFMPAPLLPVFRPNVPMLSPILPDVKVKSISQKDVPQTIPSLMEEEPKRRSPERRSAKSRLGNKDKSPEGIERSPRKSESYSKRIASSSKKESSPSTKKSCATKDVSKHANRKNKENYRKLSLKFNKVSFCRYCSYASDIVPKDRKEMTCSICLRAFHQKFELEYHQRTEHGKVPDEKQIYFECDACVFAQKCGANLSVSFIQGSAEDLVKHRLDVHGIKVHWICPEPECTVLVDNGNSRMLDEHRENKSTLPCSCIFDVKKIPGPCTTPSGRRVISLKEAMRVCVIFTCVDCKGKFSIFDTELQKLFKACNICLTPPFFSFIERNHHFIKKHGIKKGKTSLNQCPDCPSAEKMGWESLVQHRMEYHGYCMEHFICPRRGCYFMTSRGDQYYWKHLRDCKGGQKVPEVSGKTALLLKRFPGHQDIEEFLPKRIWDWKGEQSSELVSPGKKNFSSSNSEDVEVALGDDGVLGDMNEQTADNSASGEMKPEPCWDDMMTDMLQYTNELMQ